MLQLTIACILFILLGKLAGLNSNAERHVFMSTMWHNLSDAEQQSCRDEAARLNENSSDLTDEEKNIQIRRLEKKLINDVSILSHGYNYNIISIVLFFFQIPVTHIHFSTK